MQLITAEGQFHKMASDIKVQMKQRYAAEFLHEKKKKAPILDECAWRPNSGCEHSEAFQQW